MVDIYTKVILTAIAAALIGIFIQGLAPQANAQFGPTVRIDGISSYNGTLPITIRAIDEGAGRWEPIRVKQ